VESIEQAQRQLRTVVDAVARLTEQDLSQEAFFDNLLELTVSGLAAIGGAVWHRLNDQSVGIVCQRGVPAELVASDTQAGQQHLQLLLQVPASGASVSAPSANPETAPLLLLAPIQSPTATPSTGMHYVLEVFQRPAISQAAQRGYLAFVRQMADAAYVYLKNCELRQLRARQAVSVEFEQYIDAIHSSLSTRTVAYVIANEGRRLIECDRVSVAMRRRGRWRIEAVSGQDTFDRRAPAIRLLNQLVATVIPTGQGFWSDAARDHVAPQIEEALDDYLEETFTKLVGIVPLRLPAKEGEPASTPVAALVIEQIEDSSTSARIRPSAQFIAQQSVRAMNNALTHERVFLLPVWRVLGQSRVLVEARTLPKTVIAAIAAVIVLAALVLVPIDFDVHASGTLMPVRRADLFAASDGTVNDILVAHGQHVEAGQTLLKLRNTDLEVDLANVNGQIAATREQLAAIERSLVDDGRRLTGEQRSRMLGQRIELRQQLTSLANEQELLTQKRAKLHVVSPLSGEVTTWDIDQLLRQRPVRQGQVLLEVADTSAEWELELRVPEDQMGYLGAARRKLGNNLDVRYRLATDPGTDRSGKVRDVHLLAEVDDEAENTVLVRVQIDKQDGDQFQPGAECRARVHCGRRSLGYVLLHEAVGFIQSRILFRLF
ncbi:MAG TPA: HlyD family efflux transporter periplasmic adaptor subunit, partial [Pirellulales bacterium]|nr:HlyD family efflux transporter periplasmic adaptor subunit [Pirellulales bacterium]